MYEQYTAEYRRLPELLTKEDAKRLKLNHNSLNIIERKIISRNMVNAAPENTASVSVKYLSPKGKNAYSKVYNLSFDEIITEYNIVRKQIALKETSQYQRQLMSDKLRYQVIKRDKGRCTICGRTAEDGVKLHVDHIKPISKGGKTELNNLRTLCDSCNLGKGNEYKEDGWN